MGMVFCRGCGKEIHETAPTCPHCGAPQSAKSAAGTSLKSQTVAALLSVFLGGFGAHRFYLGKIASGVVYLLFCWTGIPSLIAFFEMFGIVFASPQKWAAKHNNGQLTSPVHGFVKAIVLFFPIVFIIGIVAAIIIPQYNAYKARGQDRADIKAQADSSKQANLEPVGKYSYEEKGSSGEMAIDKIATNPLTWKASIQTVSTANAHTCEVEATGNNEIGGDREILASFQSKAEEGIPATKFSVKFTPGMAFIDVQDIGGACGMNGRIDGAWKK